MRSVTAILTPPFARELILRMNGVLENAKSGRAKCVKCKKPIAKGELRFGEEVAYGDHASYRWYHLDCGVIACPVELEQTLVSYEEETGPLENRDELLAEIAKAKKKVKPKTYPYAERAPTGRAKCIQCEEKIAKDAFRIAVEREVDTGAFTTTSTGYLHPACAASYTGQSAQELGALIRAHTVSLEDADIDQLLSEL